MSNLTLDRALYREFLRGGAACCECGYYRKGAHHPKILRCGCCEDPPQKLLTSVP